MKRPVGIHRTKQPDGMEDDALVENGGISLDIPESVYRARGYLPDFDDLPWYDPDADKSPQ